MKLIQVPQRSIWLMILVILMLSYLLISSRVQVSNLSTTNELILAQRDSMTFMWTDAMNQLNQ